MSDLDNPESPDDESGDPEDTGADVYTGPLDRDLEPTDPPPASGGTYHVAV